MNFPSQTYKYFFFGVVLFYCLILGQFGFENWDTGYIPSFSWRIVNGSHPYQDFIYKGPPVTLYFHAFFMEILPQAGQFFFIRMVNYLLLALQVGLIVSALDRFYDLTGKGYNKWALMSLGFVISILDFPVYPWPTTDGLLFASIAFYLMSATRISGWRLFLIALTCLLSALTKQSFYIIPLVFLGWIFIVHGWKKTLVFLGFLLLLFALFIAFISCVASWESFVRMTTGETHFKDILRVGLYEYLIFFRNIYILLPLILIPLILTFRKRNTEPKLQSFLKWLCLVLFATAILLCGCREILLASRVAFLAAGLALGWQFLFGHKKLTYLAPAAVILAIAWSCSISLGYPYPVFFSSGILATFLVLQPVAPDFIPRKYRFWMAVPVFIMACSFAWRPYREKPLPELTYPLESVSPKLKFMKTSKERFEKYTELKNLVQQYGGNFIVAPSIPAANYLFNETSNLPADWVINTEVDRQYDLFLTLAADKKNFIFLEKSFLEGEEMSFPVPKEHSIIAWSIYKNFRAVGETKYFIIYNSLK